MLDYLRPFFIPLALFICSLAFFSRGILIFLTALCLVFAQGPFGSLQRAALDLRWVFLSLFAFHSFGDIFLGRTVRRIKIFDVSAIFFITYAYLSKFYSADPTITLERSTTVLLLYVSVFWIIWKYAYTEGHEKIVYLLLKVALLVFVASFLMIFIRPHLVLFGGRFQGIFQNPNSIGITSAILLPLSLWAYSENKKMGPLFFLLLAGLLLSASRNSINAAVISMGYLIYVRSRKYNLTVFFFLATLVLTLVWAVETLATHFFYVYFRAETIPTMGGRLEIWPYAWELILNKPFFGYGFGAEERVFPLHYYTAFHNRPIGYVHNSYLGMVLQLGIAGFIMFYAPLFILLFKELFSRQDSSTPLLRHALRASLMAGLLCGIFESWIYSVGNAQSFPFWILVMLLVFYRYQDKEKTVPESTNDNGN